MVLSHLLISYGRLDQQWGDTVVSKCEEEDKRFFLLAIWPQGPQKKLFENQYLIMRLNNSFIRLIFDA